MVSNVGSYSPVPPDLIARAPKVLLHDHLDGGLRPETIIELAQAVGYEELPSTDPEELRAWFVEAASSGSLERYLETFAHTVAVTQTADALRRVARECALDLAADNVVYAEVRYAPELHLERGLTEHEIIEEVLAGFAEGQRLAAARRAIGSGSACCSPPSARRPTPAASPSCRSSTAIAASSASTSPEPRPASRPPGTSTPSST